MDDISRAKKIGYTQAFKAITAGLVVAYLMVALLCKDLLWLFKVDFALLLIIAIAITYATGFFFGGAAGQIILVKRKPALLVGVISGFLIVSTSTFFASVVGFFMHRLGSGEAFIDYIVKIFIVITLFACIPIIVVGLWFGRSVKDKSEEGK
jgi:hypothetical protein